MAGAEGNGGRMNYQKVQKEERVSYGGYGGRWDLPMAIEE